MKGVLNRMKDAQEHQNSLGEKMLKKVNEQALDLENSKNEIYRLKAENQRLRDEETAFQDLIQAAKKHEEQFNQMYKTAQKFLENNDFHENLIKIDEQQLQKVGNNEK